MAADPSPADDLAAAKERGWRESSAIDAAFAAGHLDQQGWHDAVRALIEPAYLAADNPRAQSGHSGDAAHWERARRPLTRALPLGGGDFLDIGCANGHLMETLTAWAAQDGIRIEPYGVDISQALAALARDRCPQWSSRIWHANAMDWTPSRTFAIVRTGLDYVPPTLRGTYVRHLLHAVVAPGGRLIVGVFNEERDQDRLEGDVASMGYRVAGHVTAPHRHPGLLYKAFWVDSDAEPSGP
ncbi:MULTISPECIES: class I SAM-dependent methyltransferase [unclassified Streptomyces]|uniref:class I SAM-dependent methyltransferase n=1 Tax=unclassified Streptomyces TaxID=2593676 RepID=UPI0022566EA2|nr:MULTISPECIES: class I SAM-dependent methyltransferase [unclassified Streptomyces]WSP53165.1 class I SAM-dependent methyltransferase [Streptomyces sp. NBC_01241]WSU26116.1 class I SAM-dependent methyltransferase [Streptomyces sp. NBC_01108]MCX4799498.1 class I SAM-dependent methyltransferase [Streptomyces sp. NBC_01242]WSJ40680.1 class I SAM-dependent methyltransferase [Streptomyces sp. NBC_01321]WSP66999.1 class I SAM-dependent methyltransferase [Streptomyces sp. NBC_01240]